LADDGFWHDVAVVPDLGVRADAGAVVDVGAVVDGGVGVDHAWVVCWGVVWGGVTVVLVMGRAMGSPLVMRERWAAWRTVRTWRPLWPLVSGGCLVLMAVRKAWHSRRRGSS